MLAIDLKECSHSAELMQDLSCRRLTFDDADVLRVNLLKLLPICAFWHLHILPVCFRRVVDLMMLQTMRYELSQLVNKTVRLEFVDKPLQGCLELRKLLL